MGLWNWIWDQLTGPSAATPALRERSSAIAVIETPAACATETSAPVSVEWWNQPEACETTLQPIPMPELSTEARALQNILVEQFDGHSLSVPPLPHVAESIIQKLSDSDFDFDAIADEIAEDQVLAAAVIRIANSALYAGVEKITSLQRAISRIGANSLRMLMLHQSMRAATYQRRGQDQELADIVWQRSIAGACTMRLLAPFSSMDREEAFLIGLLQDVGNVMVLRETLKHQSVLKYRIDLRSFEYFCDLCHQELGELLAQSWNLPPTLQALISNHHDYPDPDDALRSERLTMHVAHMIQATLGYGAGGPYKLLDSKPVIDLGWQDRPDFQNALNTMPGLIELNVASMSF